MIWLSGTDKTFIWFNKQWLAFTGCTIDQALDLQWSTDIHPEDRERCVETYLSSFDAREEFVMEYRRKRHDGAWRWVLSHGVPRLGSGGNFLGFIGSAVDIHDRKETEGHLRRANSDLQQFAYSASHDLQEPIRTIAIYSQLVGKRYGSRLDETGLSFLEYLTTAAQRMEKLVRDLLLYTQTDLIDGSATKKTAANQVLTEVLASLASRVNEANAVVTSDSLPIVGMHAVHLQQLLQNLIGNGIKYCTGRQPRIHVSAREGNGCWLFSVEDNGIGIDSIYKERIFGIFKRLHTSDKYSGTGIGLAICQRIVERYGGRIWVESEPGRGSTFYFTSPV
jgi:PAS domain S-box-containing protein